jgi:predicted Zn-dependent protease
MSFSNRLENHFNAFSSALFSSLKQDEEVNLTLNAEQSNFIRFNGAKVRQNTFVEQSAFTLQFQSKQRQVVFECVLSGDLDTDRRIGEKLLQRARLEIEVLPEDAFLVPMENRGESRKAHIGALPEVQTAMDSIVDLTQGSDFVGFFAAGPQIRANQNSKGQKHWFSTESFFVDYSLFTTNVDGEDKAVKGVYSSTAWDEQELKSRLQLSKNQLSLSRRKSIQLKPGTYRTFLAPGASSELCGMLSSNALSLSALKKGSCALSKLYDGKETLSPKFSLKENFKLGFCPQFNSLGELAPEELRLIEAGQLKNMLVSSRAEKEYGTKSNAADGGLFGTEALRSPEMASGTLPENEALTALGTGLYLSNLHYLNWSDISSARLTGMTRYACFWVERGEIVGPIADMRFDDSLYQIFGESLENLTQEQHIDPGVSTYFQRDLGAKKIPGILLSQFSFTL